MELEGCENVYEPPYSIIPEDAEGEEAWLIGLALMAGTIDSNGANDYRADLRGGKLGSYSGVEANSISRASSGAVLGDPNAKGGVYELVDADGNTVYVGRTNDFARRQGEHQRDARFGHLRFRQVYATDDYQSQRGLEQVQINKHGGVGGGKLMNQRNSVALKKWEGSSSQKAAERFIAQLRR
jgi:hypothetical protein